MKNYVTAIDLGTTKTVALIGEKTEFGRYRILASCELPSRGIYRGEVDNMIDVPNLINDAVYALQRESGLEFSEIYVGIAGHHIRSVCESVKELREDADEPISQAEIVALKNKMRSIRMNPGEEILHVVPQSYNVDDRMDVTEPVGMLGKELTGNYHIVIGRTVAINKVKRCLEDAEVNLKLKKLILEPIASAAAVLDDEEKELGVALVDIGGGTTDLIVYYDNIVRHTAVIPFGGNIVTEDISKGLGILMRTAENVKIQFGSCIASLSPDNTYFAVGNEKYTKKREVSFEILSQIIDARMEEILGAVLYEIERSGFADKLNAGIVFTGGGSMLANFKQFVELKTGLSARIGKPVYLSSDSGCELAQPFYSTAVGLVIKGIENENPAVERKVTKTPVIQLEPVIVEVTQNNRNLTKEEKRKEKEERIRKRNEKENTLFDKLAQPFKKISEMITDNDTV
jgi:cell division protein FtsA